MWNGDLKERLTDVARNNVRNYVFKKSRFPITKQNPDPRKETEDFPCLILIMTSSKDFWEAAYTYEC